MKSIYEEYNIKAYSNKSLSKCCGVKALIQRTKYSYSQFCPQCKTLCEIEIPLEDGK